jgi:putative peptidoglycan lipid II flippase
MYAALYHWHGAMGLALASDLGIAIQTGTIAVLLHRRHMVSLAGLDYKEMGRCLLAGLAAGGVVWTIIWGVDYLPFDVLHTQVASAKRWTDLAILVGGSAVWIVIAKWILERTGSALPGVAMKRLGMG